MSLRGALVMKQSRSNLRKNDRDCHASLCSARNDMHIGLFGGTFNPIHHGHLKMAEAARKEYKLKVVYFIPCGAPPHKPKKDLLPAKKRLELVKKAIKGKKYFKVLDIEIKKKTKAYTIDTIMSLRGALVTKQSHNRYEIASSALSEPPRNDVKLYFLIGQDEFEKLHTWDKANQLAKLITFLVLPRLLENRKGKPMCLPKIKNLKWHLVHTKPINISSSEIRKRKK